jgi:hypothetical protein
MTVLGQVWLELIEKPAATFPHAQRGQAIALRAAVIQQGLSKPIRHELPQRRVHSQAVTDEAEDVRGADVWTEAFAVKPEHDLQDLVPLLQLGDRIGAGPTIGE